MRIVFVDARSSADWRGFARFVVKTSRAVLRRAILRSTVQRVWSGRPFTETVCKTEAFVLGLS
jgi:hypothetical protein